MNPPVVWTKRIGSFGGQIIHGLGHPLESGFAAAEEINAAVRERVLTGVACMVFITGHEAVAQTFLPSGAPVQNWVSLAASADGTHLAAAGSYGYLFLSADSGATWVMAQTMNQGAVDYANSGAVEPERPWQSVAVSADGRTVVALDSFDSVFTTTNFGANWTVSGPVLNWAAAACSADGTKMVALDYGLGGIYASADSGATWTRTSAPAKRWRCIASSADGTTLLAGTDSGPAYGDLPALYRSLDSGQTWTLTSAPAEPFQSITCSADGTRVAAAVYGGLVYLSRDAGSSWTAASLPVSRWTGLCSSGHGDKLLAAAWEGALYVSTDAGSTWTTGLAPQGQWQAVACSFDGSQEFAAIWNIWREEPTGIYAGQALTPVSGTNSNAQTTNPPALRIEVSGATVIVSWPVSLTNCKLQQTSGLDSANWSDVLVAPSVSNSRTQVRMTAEPGQRFFRLVNP